MKRRGRTWAGGTGRAGGARQTQIAMQRADRCTFENDDQPWECEHPYCEVVVGLGELIYRSRNRDAWYCSKICRDRHVRILVQQRRRADADTAKHDNHKRIERKYGVDRETWERMYDRQLGRCAICVTPLSEVVIHVDHDHVTGAVRGLLCGPCNAGIGMFGDDVAVMAAAIKYVSEAQESALAAREGREVMPRWP